MNTEESSSKDAGVSESRSYLENIRDRVRGFVSQIFYAPTARLEQSSAPEIGRGGEPLRVLSFAGGGLDAVMQLGVAHALLVTKSKAPDVVAGVSMGAINAVALAEIMQAGTHANSPYETKQRSQTIEPHIDRLAQVSTFREFFEGTLNAPGELLTSGLPDPLEINAHAPLKPQELPIHNQEERYERTLASAARFGLVRLFNGVLSIRIRISALAVAVRRCLEIKRISNTEERVWRRVLLQSREVVALWWFLSLRILVLSPLLCRVLLGILFGGSYRTLSRLEQKTARCEPLSPANKFRRRFLELCLKVFGFRRADTAKQIITQGILIRGLHRIFQYALGATCWVWLNIPFLIVIPFFFRSPKWLALFRNIDFWLAYLASVAIVVYACKHKTGWLVARLLASFDLEADLLTPFLLKPLLVRFFDRNFYGRLDFEKVIKRALGSTNGKQSTETAANGKQLRSYVENRDMPIYVAPAVANIAEVSTLGQLEVAGLNETVVDALLAACAITPLYRAQELKRTADTNKPGSNYYIDAGNLSNDPSFVILRQLRRVYSAKLPQNSLEEHAQRADIRLVNDISGIHIYPVAPFPVSRGNLRPCTTDEEDGVRADNNGKKTYSGLVEAALRAIHLQRFQDATLERKLIALYNRAIPPGNTFYQYKVDLPGGPKLRVAASATVRPIEVDHALNLNVRVLGTRNKDERREMISRAVAEGCRAAIQQLMPQTILAAASLPESGSFRKTVPCREALLRRLNQDDLLPGSPTTGGPGLQEVCKYCCLNHGSKDLNFPEAPQSLSVSTLQTPKSFEDWPIWPPPSTSPPSAALVPTTPKSSVEIAAEIKKPSQRPDGLLWPRKRSDSGELTNPAEADGNRPTVSFLFSGGVFRGVFQLGVVNALNEAGIRPDLLAGASVGTITAAMVGSVFTQKSPEARSTQLLKLAAVFLAIDRLILTDRFADFVRHITLRAAEARFSLLDADRFFRRFDKGQSGQFSARGRRVVAGLERLFNINPFRLVELTKAFRDGNAAKAWQNLTNQVENFLDHNGVGQEILGAEPLALLIQEIVLPSVKTGLSESAEFDFFLKDGGLHMLGTTTNLTQGTLEVLSSLPDNPESRVLLKEGLLASSAFPAVFRPRWSWEVYPRATTNDKLIDGGVMDNLPVDAVVSFLWRAQKRGLIKLWPKEAPHLVFTASLQERQKVLASDEARETAFDWRKLRTRAQRLSYNQKIDRFAEVQRNLRAIAMQRSQSDAPPPDWKLLNIETLVVKPEWLVGTFAFNPMLGFRRSLQAASIAHGCAATLAELQTRFGKGHAKWLSSWGLKTDLKFHLSNECEYLAPLSRTSAQRREGMCWFRNDTICPFSAESVKKAGFDSDCAAQIDRIYQLCGEPRTHRPNAPEKL